jgi:choline kinase
MKKNLYDMMKESTDNEAELAKSKPIDLEKRFRLADKLFDKHIHEDNRDAKKNKETQTIVIRDSFSFPEEDYKLIEIIKNKLLLSGKNITKSEVLRLGLLILDEMSESKLRLAFEKIKKIKVGRK